MSDDPDALARLVHEQRLAHEADRAATEGRVMFDLKPWEERAEHQRELDRRIAFAVAARAVADAGLENTRKDAQLFALTSVMPAVLDALRAAAADAKYEAQAKRFTAALEVLGGGEGQERSDEKEPQ